MRDAFNAELQALAVADPDVLLLTADIGFKVFDQFREACPGRFLNMGVAESNMMGVAAGLALGGKRPFVYTIIPFLTMRAFEQIRVDVCIQNLPVKIVGVGGGLAYGILGPTHHAIEDVAILRALPNLTVVTPCDPLETRLAVRAAAAHPGPVYLRLGKNGEPALHRGPFDFQLGRAVTLREGADAAILAAGPILGLALDAAAALAQQGIEVRIVDVHTIKPLDREAVERAGRETRAVVSLEEHSIIGGLGSAVAEALAEAGLGVPFRRLGVPDRFCYGVGSQAYHWRTQGLTADGVAQTVRDLLAAVPRRRRSRSEVVTAEPTA